jgi:TetR/AcrR family transcriptional regulator, transcriptional repressor for nem operon
MRYSTEHKKETRERIVKAASQQFRRRGGKGLAIADLMSKLDLTHGGFYKHFDSKQQLLAEAIAKSFDETDAGFMEAIRKAKRGNELKVIIEHYLSLEHCANSAEGCPMAALVSEISRYSRSMRLEINRAMKKRVQRLSEFLPGATAKERERNCMVLLSGMVGAVSLARAVLDPESRQAILDASKDFYIKAFCS